MKCRNCGKIIINSHNALCNDCMMLHIEKEELWNKQDKKSVLQIIVLIVILFTLMILGLSFVDAALSDNLIACYDFEDSGNLGNNIAQVGIDGTNNGVTQAGGILGNAGQFTQSQSDNIEITNILSNGLNPNNAYTACSWLSMDTESDDNWILSMSQSGSTSQYWGMFYSQASDIIRTQFRVGGVWNVKDTIVGDTNWHFFCVNLDSNGKVINPFVDGTFYTNDTTNTLNPTTWNKAYIGVLWFNAALAGYFDGQIDDTFIWNRTLTGTEMLQLYNTGNGYSCEDIIVGAGITPSLTIYTDIENNFIEEWVNNPYTIFYFTINATIINNSNYYTYDIYFDNELIKTDFINFTGNHILNFSFEDITANATLNITVYNENATDSLTYNGTFVGNSAILELRNELLGDLNMIFPLILVAVLSMIGLFMKHYYFLSFASTGFFWIFLDYSFNRSITNEYEAAIAIGSLILGILFVLLGMILTFFTLGSGKKKNNDNVFDGYY